MVQAAAVRLAAWVLVLTTASACWAAEAGSDPPLGHPDFYPSPARPIGYRGDGNGYFPGAEVATEWCEGSPVQVDMSYHDQWGNLKQGKGWDFTDGKSRNIVWKTQMPSWANTQPVVVGDRVFTIAEPDLLVCVDANTGQVLWTAENNVWELAGLEPADARKCHDLFEVQQALVQLTPKNIIPPVSVPATFIEKCLPRIVEALNRIDPDGQWDQPAQATRKALEDYVKAGGGEENKDRKGWPALAAAIDKRLGALAGRKIPTTNTWGHMVGFCMSVPVSDGQYVYASFGQGQTVCYDLSGRRIWARYIEHEAGSRTSQIQSPLLAGDILVDMHGGPKVLRGLDRKTGQVMWEAPTKGEHEFGKGGGYYVGSHKVVRLGAELYVATSLCNIIRARDGKVVGVLPWEHGPSGGPSIASGGKAGDIVLKSSCGDNYSTPVAAYRLKADGADKVTAEMLWQTADRTCPGYQGQVVTPEHVIMTSAAGNVMEMETGSVVKAGAKRGALGNYSNILAGNTLLWLPDGSRDPLGSHWSKRRQDGKAMMEAFAADVSDPKAPKLLSGTRILGGVNASRVPAMEKYAPEMYALPEYWGDWSCYGKPPHFIHVDTAWMPMGNRLFLRTVGHMYCIGDPAVPYNWNPRSRPAGVAAK